MKCKHTFRKALLGPSFMRGRRCTKCPLRQFEVRDILKGLVRFVDIDKVNILGRTPNGKAVEVTIMEEKK
jgi:hypothetical protein